MVVGEAADSAEGEASMMKAAAGAKVAAAVALEAVLRVVDLW